MSAYLGLTSEGEQGDQEKSLGDQAFKSRSAVPFSTEVSRTAQATPLLYVVCLIGKDAFPELQIGLPVATFCLYAAHRFILGL